MYSVEHEGSDLTLKEAKVQVVNVSSGCQWNTSVNVSCQWNTFGECELPVEYIRVNVSCQWNTQKCEIAKVSVKTFESSRPGEEQ